ncbi:MAG: (2Fe-2S)-binding protein [Bacteriovorax sp.]|jgi:hypothetical protein
MSKGHAVYKNSEGLEVHLHLDVDLKTEKIQDFIIKGSLGKLYEGEFFELKELVLNHSLKEALNLKRNSLKNETRLPNGKLPAASLSLWLFQKAVEDYLGSAATLNEQKDLLCLCFGIGIKELKKQIVSRSDYGLTQLVAETLATSACGSCLPSVLASMKNIREEHGLIEGLEHSQSRLDRAGHWIKIKGLYPAELLLKLDELKLSWMKRERIEGNFSIEITRIEGYHLWLKVTPDNDIFRSEGILSALSEYWRGELGALFFLHLAEL